MTLSWFDLKAMVRMAPRTSAIKRAVDPDWWVTNDLILLREAVHGLRVLAWQKTEAARRGRDYPKPIALTAAEREADQAERRYTALPAEEVLVRLGWN